MKMGACEIEQYFKLANEQHRKESVKLLVFVGSAQGHGFASAEVSPDQFDQQFEGRNAIYATPGHTCAELLQDLLQTKSRRKIAIWPGLL